MKSRVQSYFDGIKADWLDSIRPQKEGDFRKEVKINMTFFLLLITILGLVTYEVFLVNGNIKSVVVKSVPLIFFFIVKYLFVFCISGSVVLDSVPSSLSLYPCVSRITRDIC